MAKDCRRTATQRVGAARPKGRPTKYHDGLTKQQRQKKREEAGSQAPAFKQIRKAPFSCIEGGGLNPDASVYGLASGE